MTIGGAYREYLEERYILDFTMLARTRARRDELFAFWAAKELGRPDPREYLAEVRRAGDAVPGDRDVLQKIVADLRSKGNAPDEDDLRCRMNDMMFEAAAELDAERAAGAGTQATPGDRGSGRKDGA